jgi:regulatory protein YycH of two-component signal transduction system YycFG
MFPVKMKNVITVVLFVLVVLVPAVLVFGIYFFGPELSHLLSGG